MKSPRLITLILVGTVLGCTNFNTSNEVIAYAKPGLSQSQEEKWNQMIGKWYGSQTTKEGGIRQQITVRHPDGTYQHMFKLTEKDGKVILSSEVGYWGISGPVYFTIFRGWIENGKVKPSDPSDPYNYDAYKIIELTKDHLKYKHFTTDNVFTIEKVDHGFDFPDTI